MELVMTALQNDILKLVGRIGKALQAADPDSLDWRPGPDTNSPAVLTMHALGSVEFLVAAAVGEPIERDFPADFRTLGVDKSALLARVAEVEGRVRTWLASASPSILGETRMVRNQPRSVAFLLVHAADHLAEHLGHLELTSQLWSQAHAKSAAPERR